MHTTRTVTLVAAAMLSATRAASAQGGGVPALPGHVVDVVAGDYFFRAPDSVRAGLTTFRLRSPQGGHGAWVIRLHHGHGVGDFVAAQRAGVKTPWAHNLGGPASRRRMGARTQRSCSSRASTP